MSRSGKLSVEAYIEVDGKTLPFYSIDKEGSVTWYVSEEKRAEYERRMLKNIGEGMSRFYAAHPEYLKEKADSDK